MVQTSGDALIQLLILGLCLGAAIWLIATFEKQWKWLGLLATIMLSIQIFNNLPTPSLMQADANSTSWTPTIESELQSNNQAYLINFTAAWCITCQTNEKAALGRDEVQAYLMKEDIQYIKADWTNRNEDIAVGLAQYNRTGIPLYIFWKPGMSQSKILPAVLTEDLLIRYLK